VCRGVAEKAGVVQSEESAVLPVGQGANDEGTMTAAQAGGHGGRDVFVEKQLECANVSPLSGDELSSLGQHSLEGGIVHGIVFGESAVDLFGECLRVVDCGLHFGLGPAEMFGDGVEIAFVTAKEENDLPYGKTAALNAGLAACGRVAEVDEGEFGAAQTLLHEAGAGIAGRPTMTARHAFEAVAACGGEAHADDGGWSGAHL
jgi:hypothetical protein